MQVNFKVAKLQMDVNGFWLALKLDNPADGRRICSEIEEGKEYIADIKRHYNKRSLDANAYFWVLCGKLAAKIGLPPEEIYREYIRDIGDNYQIVPIRNDAVDQWIKAWRAHGIGWICDNLGPSKIDGYTNIICYYGSSVYDTAQMSRLINLLVEDCKAQGIETKTPDEIQRMVSLWDA